MINFYEFLLRKVDLAVVVTTGILRLAEELSTSATVTEYCTLSTRPHEGSAADRNVSFVLFTCTVQREGISFYCLPIYKMPL